MNTLRKILAPCLLILVAASLALSGCAGMEAHQKESLLSAAGFRARMPSTPKQQAIFNSMTPYKMQRRMVHGRMIYAYADPRHSVVYVGTQLEYDAYKALAAQQNIAEEQEMAAAMNQETAMDWGMWGPMGIWY